jgi:hypothetical protein
MTTITIPPDFVPLSEGARLYGMNREKLLRRCGDGRIEAMQVLGRWYVRRPNGSAT